MSLLESVEDKLSAQIEEWEKQLDEQKAKLKSDIAEAENEQATDSVRDEAKKSIETNIEALQSKISQAKEKLADTVGS